MEKGRIKKFIILGIVVIMIGGVLLWYFPTINPYFWNSSANSSGASYTKLMIRNGNIDTLEFGDTEYILGYTYPPSDAGFISVIIPFNSSSIKNPQVGHTYKIFGAEIKVSNVSSDNISSFVVILVKPTIGDYMFSTYRYTKVDIPYCVLDTVKISSGLTNKTNQYTFGFTSYTQQPFNGAFQATLAISNSTQSEQYPVNQNYRGSNGSLIENDFNIEVRLYKVNSSSMIIYVKPLY